MIMGCGRVGTALARAIEAHGHTLAMIDNNPDSFRRLPKDFAGQKVTGEGYDKNTQRQAGIEDAYGFAAVADDDNANILAARIAREIYGVKKVVARIADPKRAQVYERLGIPTVGTVDRTAQSLLARVLPLDTEVVFTEETGKLVLCRALIETSWVGRTIAEVEKVLGVRAAYVLRFSKVSLVSEDTVLQENDELYYFTREAERPAVSSRLARAFKED